jgi:hypothetical protein
MAAELTGRAMEADDVAECEGLLDRARALTAQADADADEAAREAMVSRQTNRPEPRR